LIDAPLPRWKRCNRSSPANRHSESPSWRVYSFPPGKRYGFIGPFDITDVIGTNSSETVYVEANGRANFDPSFNRGGDEIIIQSVFVGLRRVVRSGSNLLITNETGALLSIPFGSAGSTITFNDGSFELVFSSGTLKLGDQVITATAAPLADLGEGIAASALAVGAMADPVPVDFAASSNLLLLG